MMIRFDSRMIQPGDTFLCLPNAEKFVEEASRKGATKIIRCDRQEMAIIAADFFQHPSKKLKIVGVTGTKGKTTTTQLVAHILNQSGYKAHVIGTLSGNLTTPESIEIQEIMADKLKQGFTHIVMEVSSIGIDQHRVDQIDFTVKLLTNITQDHLDYHKTMEAYAATKHFFMKNFSGVSIYPEDYSQYKIDYTLPLGGRFNLLNAKAAGSICTNLGLTTAQIRKGLMTAPQVPGRFEKVDAGQDYLVIVDYAHSPDSLKNILECAGDLRATQGKGSIITMFGCGGGRDRLKRPIMAGIAEELSDKVIVTTDNPRTEIPMTIIEEIMQGFKNKNRVTVLEDRHAAIKTAIGMAKPGDIVVLAGKGHEDYQIVGTEKHHFDDREEARKAIKGRG